MKTGLVLEGGAKRGIYTAGVLDVLYDEGISVDGVLGVSAGAIHGCSYVSGQRGRSIRYTLKYGNDRRFMSIYSLLTTGDLVGAKFCYQEIPEKLDMFDYEAFEKSPIKFYVTCSNLETGRAEYIYCDELREKMDYLRASASLPLVSRIVEIGGKKYLDGGITDSIPLKGMEKLGYDRNIVVLTRPKGYRKKASFNRYLAGLIYKKYPKFVEAIKNRHLMYNQALEDIEALEKAGRILVIRPSRKIKISKTEKNPQIVKAMYDLGVADVKAQLEKIQNFLALK